MVNKKGNKELLHFDLHDWCFRINKGHTMYVERKICGRLHGKSSMHFLALGGWKELKYDVSTK